MIHEERSETQNIEVNKIEQELTPQCCGTGCTVCVLDYPELSGDRQSADEAEMLAMLEAIENAVAEINIENAKKAKHTK